MRLDGRTVVVTGGSRGLGKAMVHAFAAHGANVVIASRKIESCELLARHIRMTYGVEALPLACNVSEWSSCDQLVDDVYTRFGAVDTLVNNAGASPTFPSLESVSEGLFDKIIGVNLKGAFRLSSLIGSKMASAGGGTILNISSMEADRPSPDALPYAMAKSGLNSMTVGMSKAFGPSVRVNAIQCGPFLTDIAAAWNPVLRDEFAATLALRRCAEPEEIVGAALFLTSDESSFCTGAVLKLDGGLA